MQPDFLEIIIKLFDRDLKKLEHEITLYQQESLLWEIRGDIKNSSGNLCLHLCGNLQHYIGKVLGGSSYARNREAEFSTKNISKERLLNELTKTRETVLRSLESLDASLLSIEYPEAVFDYPMTTGYFLVHLHGHLNYHLGQINYHRRLIST
jgi:uncharacterized damage-inducible protein DinB